MATYYWALLFGNTWSTCTAMSSCICGFFPPLPLVSCVGSVSSKTSRSMDMLLMQPMTGLHTTTTGLTLSSMTPHCRRLLPVTNDRPHRLHCAGSTSLGLWSIPAVRTSNTCRRTSISSTLSCLPQKCRKSATCRYHPATQRSSKIRMTSPEVCLEDC